MLFVLNSLAIGGSETKIIKVANALASTGVRVKLAYLNPPQTGLGRVSPAVQVTHLHRRGKYSFSSLRRLRELIDNESQVVVAVNLYPLLYVIPAVKLTKFKNVRAVGLVNTSVMVGKEAFFARGYAPFLKRCSTVIFGCMAQRSNWVERYNLPPERTRVIYNGVDHELFSPDSVAREGQLLRRKLKIPDGAMIIGSIGRLAPEKNFSMLVKAIARMRATRRDPYLVLVGTGDGQKLLQKQAIEEGVEDRVSFAGLLDDVRPALSMMDMFVLPSSSVETFSNAALEAMAMARAVVLSEIGGAAEMVENGKSGILFPVGGTDTLTDILNRLYDHDGKRKALGAAARERVIDLFGFGGMVAQYSELVSRPEHWR